MNFEKVLKYQLSIYIFIIVFGIQNYYFGKFNFGWKYYEAVAESIFIISFFTVISSIILLIIEGIIFINRRKVKRVEIVFLFAGLLLYYAVIWTSLYLSTQIRL